MVINKYPHIILLTNYDFVKQLGFHKKNKKIKNKKNKKIKK